MKTKLLGSKAKAAEQGQLAAGSVTPGDGGDGAVPETLSLRPSLHPRRIYGVLYTATLARCCRPAQLCVRTGTRTCRPRFSRQPGPGPGPAWCNHKSLLLSPKRTAPCHQPGVPMAGRGASLPAGTRSCRGRGFRGSRVFVLPQEKVGATKEDVKKTSRPRSSPPHAPSQPSGAKPLPPRLSPCPG